MSDISFFFFFVACLYSIQRNKIILFLIFNTLGVFSKELILLTIPRILLKPNYIKSKIIWLLATMPALICYIFIRVKFTTTPYDIYVTGQVLNNSSNHLLLMIKPNGLINMFFSFGILWIPCFYAIIKGDIPILLKRWSWLILIIFLGILFGSGNMGRSFFTAFPIVIPISLSGLLKWLDAKNQSFLLNP